MEPNKEFCWQWSRGCEPECKPTLPHTDRVFLKISLACRWRLSPVQSKNVKGRPELMLHNRRNRWFLADSFKNIAAEHGLEEDSPSSSQDDSQKLILRLHTKRFEMLLKSFWRLSFQSNKLYHFWGLVKYNSRWNGSSLKFLLRVHCRPLSV